MTPVILYHSRTGFTQQYATWLSEDLRCPALPYRERGGIHWSKYDTILFGSWFHAGSVMGKKWLKQQLPQWKEKHVILFVTGAAPAGEAPARRRSRAFRIWMAAKARQAGASMMPAAPRIREPVASP